MLFLTVSVLIPVFLGVSGAFSASAAYEVPEFESRNPGILPISPFYFLKQWRRDIIRSFTKDPLSQAVFELKTLDEKAAELKRVRDLRPDDVDMIAEALKNYKKSQITLKEILKGLDTEQIKSEKKERLVAEIVKKVVAHEEYLTLLSDAYTKEKTVHPLTEGVQELAVEVVKASQVIAKEKFEDIAKGYLRENVAFRMISEETIVTGTASSSVATTTTTPSALLIVSTTTEEFIPAIKGSDKKSQ